MHVQSLWPAWSRHHRAGLRWTLGALLAFLALNAFAGGIYGMTGAPGVPRQWLEGTPLSDYFVPSIVLFVLVGGALAIAAQEAMRGTPATRPSAALAGCVVLVWLAAQVAIIGYVSWMQPATAAAGLAILGLAWLLPADVPAD